ncbi:MAG TPA: hypothetical protein VHM94_11650 [Acidimicrobiia bacterium]|jgi:hypothetical protein|nr:hypothetical protein [Acidimicrobiia bacterium]
MEDDTGDGDKLERLRHVMEGIDPDEVARMGEPPTPRGKWDRSDPNARFPWLGVIVILVGVAFLVLILVVAYFVTGEDWGINLPLR